MKRTKKEWEKIIGHSIRNDTYLVLERIQNNETYEEIIDDLAKNREIYHINLATPLVKFKTVKSYLSLINEKIEDQKELPPNRRKNSFNSGGIYGIYDNDELIYIGQTRKFSDRFSQHKSGFKYEDKPLYIYMRKQKENGHILSIKPIIDIEKINVESISRRDLEAMELALITLYKPKCNYEGVIIPYEFNYK